MCLIMCLRANIASTNEGQLTCDRDGYLLRDDGSHVVPGVALVAPGVLPGDGLDLVEVLRGELREEHAVSHPSVFRLRVTCEGGKI